MTIRLLGPGQGPLFAALWHEALRAEPETFVWETEDYGNVFAEDRKTRYSGEADAIWTRS